MSQANRVGKQNARERVLAEKIRRQRAERRRKQMTIGSVVVLVVVAAGAVGIAVAAAKKDGTPYLAPAAAVVDPVAKSSKDLGIHVGSADAPVKMTVFEDFRCPVCQEVETTVEPTYRQYVQDGKLQITYHPARVIDSHDNGTGSLNAANAAACAQDQEQFLPLHDLFYANQPDEKTDPWADKSKILTLADQVPALKASADFQTCVTKGSHNGWVQANADNFNKIGLQGTPTIYIDNQQVSFTNQQTSAQVMQYFQQQLDAAFQKDGGKAGTKTTLPAAPTSSAPSGAAGSSAPSASGSSASGTPTASGSASSQPSSSGSSASGATPSSSKS